MASTSLGRLYVDLLMKTGSFETDAGRAAKIAEKRAREIDRAFAGAMSSVKNNIIGVGVALIGINSFVALAQKGFAVLIASIDNADKVNELSTRLGISTEKLSAWGYAAKQSGSDLDSLGAAIPKLSKNIAGAADATSSAGRLFAALGVEVTDANGKLRDVEDVLPEISDRFKALTNDTEKQALATELFGKSGAGMIEFLELGADGMKALTDRAAELGITISGETAAGADAFNDKLSELKAVSEGLTAQVAAELLPNLIELVDWAIQFTADGDNARDIAARLGAAFGFLADTATIVGDVFNVLGTAIGGALAQASGMLDVATGLVTLDWGKIKFGASLFGEGQKAAVNAAVFGTDNNGGSLVNSGRPRALRLPNAAGIDFSRGAPMSPGDKALEGRVSRYFSSSGKSGSSKSVKPALTEEQKRAQELQRAYESLNATMAERLSILREEAITGEQVGEAWKVSYEIQSGGLKGLTEAKAKELIASAQSIDMMNAESEAKKELAALDKQKTEQFESTYINLQDEFEALGLSNEALRIRNELQRAGVTLDGNRKDAITAMVKSIEAEAKKIEGLDKARGVAYDFFVDLPNGAANAWKNALASIESMLLQWAAKGLVEQLFGQMGTNGQGNTGGLFGEVLGGIFGGGASGGSGGSGGTNWGGIFASIFGGGRADGGPVMGGKMYDVTERGLPELVTIRNRQLMIMPPGTNGKVTPMRAGGGGGITVNQTLVSQAPFTRRSTMQLQQEAAFNIGMASRRS